MSSTLRSPYVIIAAGCLIVLLINGIRNSMGVFLAPMSADLGWGRETFAFAIALQNLLWGIGQPFAGAIADRYGSGRVIATGILAYATGIFVMSQTSTPLMLELSAGVLIGIGLSGTGIGIVLASIGRAVPEERRSWALGLGTAAASFGQFTMTPIGHAFLAAYGWSTALTILACMSLLALPLSRLLAGRGARHAGPEQTLREALREATRHRGYVCLTLGFFVCGFHVAFIAAHMPAYVVDLGLAASVGAWAIAVVGLFNIVGSFTSGVLGGRYSKKYLLSCLYLTRAVVIALFMVAPKNVTTVLVFSAAMGLLWLSTVPLTTGLVAQIFGPRHMAMLVGIVFLSHQIGSFIGVWMGGYLYDTTGSYDQIWWWGVGLGVAAALVHYPIDERPVGRLAQALP